MAGLLRRAACMVAPVGVVSIMASPACAAGSDSREVFVDSLAKWFDVVDPNEESPYLD